jgi:hypothetical protein
VKAQTPPHLQLATVNDPTPTSNQTNRVDAYADMPLAVTEALAHCAEIPAPIRAALVALCPAMPKR